MIRLAIRVERERAELVLAELLDLLPDGVEELDLDERTVEYAAYGAPGELPALPALEAAVGDTLVEISTSEIADDWPQRWQRFHRPVVIPAPAPRDGRVVPGLRVRPPWEPPAQDAAPALEEIVIDPGQAFGTGSHATTRLCLEMLLELAGDAPARTGLIDVGTGSGVLAIAAVRLGFAPVLAIDNDAHSERAARENASVNGAAVEVLRMDLRTHALPRPARPGDDGGRTQPGRRGRAPALAPIVCANLLRPLLLDLAASLCWAPPALIAGGLLSEEVDEVVAAFASSLGLRERERRARGEWSAVLLEPGDQPPSRISVAARTFAR